LLTGEAPPTDLINQQQPTQPTQQTAGENEELADFAKVVFKYTEDVWDVQFPKQLGHRYSQPVLVLYSGTTQAACGMASAASGPFYCPADQKVYIDLNFFRDLKRQFGASGDFAYAYIMAHEVGHHVQYLLGITDQVHKMRRRLSQKEYNKLSVKLELQADYFAGVWAHHIQKTKHVLDEGDIEEAIRAANSVGDDRLQKQHQGYVVPDAFTHGTSEQRMKWFIKGFRSGNIQEGDTFNTTDL
jgi:predicted metalloprotease